MSHPNSKISQSGNLCIISGVGERGCKQYASQDGGRYFNSGGDSASWISVGMYSNATFCMYILESVAQRAVSQCIAMGGTVSGDASCLLENMPNQQSCSDYVSNHYDIALTPYDYTYWTDSKKCYFKLLSLGVNAYVGADIPGGTCMHEGMIKRSDTGNCRCPDGYGVNYSTGSNSCEICGSGSDRYAYGCGEMYTW